MYSVACEVTHRSTERFTARCQTRSGAPRTRGRGRGRNGSEGIVSLVLAVVVFCGSFIQVRASYGHVLVTMSTPELNTTVRVSLDYQVNTTVRVPLDYHVNVKPFLWNGLAPSLMRFH